MVTFRVLTAVVVTWIGHKSLNHICKICVILLYGNHFLTKLLIKKKFQMEHPFGCLRFSLSNEEFRFYPYFISHEVSHTPCFIFVFRVKDIQSVYLDTTFCDPKYYQIPSRVRLPGARPAFLRGKLVGLQIAWWLSPFAWISGNPENGKALTAFEPSCPGGVSARDPGAGSQLDHAESIPRSVAELQGRLRVRVSLHQPQRGVRSPGAWRLFLSSWSCPSSQLCLSPPSPFPPKAPPPKTGNRDSLCRLCLFASS